MCRPFAFIRRECVEECTLCSLERHMVWAIRINLFVVHVGKERTLSQRNRTPLEEWVGTTKEASAHLRANGTANMDKKCQKNILT
jgi:hypothetical protein